MKLLHVIATPRHHHSNTLPVSDAFIEQLSGGRGDVTVEVIDLYDVDLPAIAGDNIETKYTLLLGNPIDKAHEESWSQIVLLIDRFMAADAILISSPMWNLSIPYALKYYIDCIVQPGYLFRYDENGIPVPLVHDKKMLCITSRGGDYSISGYIHHLDFQEPYLRAIFGFVGVTDMSFINVQPMDISPVIRAAAIEAATIEARALAGSSPWSAPEEVDLTVEEATPAVPA
jgi:FMN-dependent NADH-azoreductase